MPLWADSNCTPSDSYSRCCDGVNALVQIAVGQIGDLTAPIEPQLQFLAKTQQKVAKRLNFGTTQALDALTSSAQMIASALHAATGESLTRLGVLESLCGSGGCTDGAGRGARGGDTVVGPQVIYQTAPSGSPQPAQEQPVDIDEPHVMKFAEGAERWHQQMIAFYGAPMAAFLSISDITSLMADGQLRGKMLAEAHSPLPVKRS
jgi:hypothetical protein